MECSVRLVVGSYVYQLARANLKSPKSMVSVLFFMFNPFIISFDVNLNTKCISYLLGRNELQL